MMGYTYRYEANYQVRLHLREGGLVCALETREQVRVLCVNMERLGVSVSAGDDATREVMASMQETRA